MSAASTENHRRRSRTRLTRDQMIHYFVLEALPVGLVLISVLFALGMTNEGAMNPFISGGIAMGYSYFVGMYAPKRLGFLPREALAGLGFLAAAVVLAVVGVNPLGVAAVCGMGIGIAYGLLNRRFAPGLGDAPAKPATATS